MAEYKRFISYMYMYKKGLKDNNIGFAKIEARNGSCKFIINVKDDKLKDNKWTIAVFHRGNNENNMRNVDIIKIEELDCKKDEYIGTFTTDVNNVFGSGISLDKIAGVILIGDMDNYIGTEWDDNGIDYKTIKLENENVDKEILENSQVKKIDINNIDELNKENKVITKESIMDADIEQVESTIKEENNENNIKVADEKNNSKEIKEETINFNKFNEARIINKQVEVPKQNQIKPYIKRLFDGFPGMYPFEDDEIIDCVKLEPHDIGIFPMDKWQLANNSFLLHGYYTYRHLIFARLKRDNKMHYILGVPGIFRDRERFMAKMFGFSNFKGVRNQPLNVGEFGYWYMYINV